MAEGVNKRANEADGHKIMPYILDINEFYSKVEQEEADCRRLLEIVNSPETQSSGIHQFIRDQLTNKSRENEQ
ncbi:MAG: hypothetical protein ACRC0J_05785 [Shewanella oncorhynchi]